MLFEFPPHISNGNIINHNIFLGAKEPNQTRSLENVMFYKKLIESKARGSRETHEQLKARDEGRSTAAFTQGDYASMCRGEIPEVFILS